MFVIRKLIIAIIGLGIAFIISSCNDSKKPCSVVLEHPVKDKPEKLHKKW
jgi:hypothetical protein